MYYVKCTSINVPEKSISKNGQVTYAYNTYALGIVHTSVLDEQCKMTLKDAHKVNRSINGNRYEVEIVKA